MLNKQFVAALLLGLPLLLGGCGNAESALATAAQQRWDAVIGGDLERAYGYYTDAFRQATPFGHFRNELHGVGLWSRAHVKEVKCEPSGERCQVGVDVTVSMKMRGLAKPMDTTELVQETWVKQGWFSDWRYVKG